ncbi:hypothetical protein [Nonomuraea sp. SYSU D8015]|uniref:hypothetical protein n=1 Tax=Nonomuraea sp. SYSU D8015 TaxID=2593644 RepID=UPI00166072A1|nr:hypothetical protein [Nonomuraea sp. SYSU D8015]
MISCALTIWGILRDPISRQPSDHGRTLLASLMQGYRVHLLADEPADEEWLRLEKFTGYVSLSLPRPGHPMHDERLYQVAQLRAGGPLDLVVDPDPRVCADLFNVGQATLLYSHPRYTHLRHRPGLRAWADLEHVIDTTRQLEANAA